ncbi:MAG: transglycosylase SLT domain-containing protein [Myxococcales bacterium]|nr:transglycosylase SLT domain-containing protein [Myxococcales bacterium]
MVRATVVACVLLATATSARADDAAAQRLGQAFAAYDAGDLAGATAALAGLEPEALANPDYLLWLRGQVALLDQRPADAARAFAALAAMPDSRFARTAAWRAADAAWDLGQRVDAARSYARLRAAPNADDHADLGVVAYRIAVAAGEADPARGQAALRDFLATYPAHPLAAEADRALVAAGAAPTYTAEDRIARAQRLVSAHAWDAAVAELTMIDARVPKATRIRRDYWLGTTLFKMRRRYADAGRLLLSVADEMRSAEALFHGARALSRADHDDDAIRHYRRVVKQYPKTSWAEEAQYLTGWLEFNRGDYRKAIGPLAETIRRYPKSKWMDDALWFLGMSHYLVGDRAAALPHLAKLAARSGSLEAGKGAYWQARALDGLGRADEATPIYQRIVGRWPFSWYALLATARLGERGVAIGPFGTTPPSPRGPEIADTIEPALVADPAIRAFDELITAGLATDAGVDLARRERGFVKRHPRAQALAVLFERYGAGRNWTRPWKLANAYDGGALDTPAEGRARPWWLHAYPEAYKDLVERYRPLGGSPPYYLYAIMRKESGYDPGVLSYADAQGLLQMIPATTIRVARQLHLTYAPGDLYAPELNIHTGSWYIGRLLAKFNGQIPIGAGSFNSGPRPVVKWVAENGARPIDEFVELVSYVQTREYMKKVTENYARYVYLYTGEVYAQPLVVDQGTIVDDLTY